MSYMTVHRNFYFGDHYKQTKIEKGHCLSKANLECEKLFVFT